MWIPPYLFLTTCDRWLDTFVSTGMAICQLTWLTRGSKTWARKFSWLEEEQNIEDLLATPSSKKVYYRGFLETQTWFANGLPSEICGGRTERSETPCCHQETLEQDKIETNKLRTRRLGKTDCSFILYDVFSWTLSLLTLAVQLKPNLYIA